MLKADRNSIILGILIMIQPLLDIVSFFAIKMELTAITSMLRLVIFAAVMVYAFILSDRKKPYYIFAGIAGVYWICHMLVCFVDGYELVSDTNGFLRTIQMPAMTLAFITLFQRAKKFPDSIGKFFIANYVTIAASILLSYAVNMPEPTYVINQVGVKGWFAVGNSQSYIIAVMALPALYAAYREKNNILFIFTIIIAFTQMFLMGTLVTLYSIFITAVAFLVIIAWNREKRWVMIASLVIALAVTVLVYPYSPSQQVSNAEQESLLEWEEMLEEHEKKEENNPEASFDLSHTILADLVERFGYDRVLEIYGGEIDAEELMDNRLQKVNFGRLVMAEKNIGSWLFGFEDADMYFKGETYDPENDFPAIFFFYGIVGVLLYVVFLGYFAFLLLKDICKNLKKLPVDKVVIGLSLVLSMGCAELSANVLRRPNASIYISLLLAYAYYVCKIRKEQEHESECNHSGL